MRSPKLGLCMLLLALLASACSNGNNDNNTTETLPTTIRPSIPTDNDGTTSTIGDDTTEDGTIGDNTSAENSLGDPTGDINTSGDSTVDDDNGDNTPSFTLDNNVSGNNNISDARPDTPRNLTCSAGAEPGQLLIEWDAPDTNGAPFNKVYLYLAVGYGPIQLRDMLSLDAIDTSRDNNTRWATHIGNLPEDSPLRIRVTHVDDSDGTLNESRWEQFDGIMYKGAGSPCEIVDMLSITTETVPTTSTSRPITSCTAGC